MEAILKSAVEVCDEDYGIDGNYVSRIRKDLQWRYRKQHFFAFTRRSKEALYLLFTILFVIAVGSYFFTHFMLYVTGYYSHPMGTMVAHAYGK